MTNASKRAIRVAREAVRQILSGPRRQSVGRFYFNII